MNKLNQLIFSLEKKEAIFVKNQLKQRFLKTSKDYLKLWDSLLNNNPKISMNRAMKQELYQTILDALDLYHRESSKIEQVKKQLHLISILIKKGLLEEVKKMLKKVSQQIYTYELLEQLPEYILLKKNYLLAIKNTDLEKAQAAYIELNEGLDILKNINSNWWLKRQMAHLHHQKIANTSMLPKDTSTIQNTAVYSLRANLDNLKAWALFHFIHQNTKAAYNCNKQLLELFDQHAQLIELYPQQYLTTFYNYLIDSQIVGAYGFLKKGIQQLRTFPQQKQFKNIPNLELKVFELGYMLELNMVVAQKKFEEGLITVVTLEKELKRYKTKLATHSFLTFHYLMAYIYFANQEYEQVLTILNKIRQTPQRNIVEELLFFADWLYMLSHFELGNYLLLESLLTAHKRVKRKLLLFPQLQAILFNLCKKLAQPLSKQQEQTHWKTIQSELNNLKKSSPERRAWQYFDYDIWLLTKL